MADKILMNKNTLAALKLELKGYQSALPVFEMKEQKLKETMLIIEESLERLESAYKNTEEEVKKWVAVMAEDGIDTTNLVRLKEVNTMKRDVAGVMVETFNEVRFEETEIDYFSTPLWVDAAVVAIQDQKTNLVMINIEKENLTRIMEELFEARRMKNALKEVFIPEVKHNIRKIEIYLGDVERLAIGCAKLVKKKKIDKTVAS